MVSRNRAHAASENYQYVDMNFSVKKLISNKNNNNDKKKVFVVFAGVNQ